MSWPAKFLVRLLIAAPILKLNIFMRYSEFKSLPIIDVTAIMIKEATAFFDSNEGNLHENAEYQRQYRNLISTLRNGTPSEPIVGQLYAPLAFSAIPFAKFVVVFPSSKLLEFVKKTPAKKLKFLDGDKIVEYPAAVDSTIETGSMQIDTILFDDPEKVSQAVTMLGLKFGDWHIKFA